MAKVKKSIGLIGCGHMGSAIVSALLSKKIPVIASKRTKPKISLSKITRPLFTWTVDNKRLVNEVDIVVIAVKPSDVAAVLQEIAPLLSKNHVLLSIAAGVSIASLKKNSGNHSKIVRVLPNLSSQVLKGVSVWKALPSLTSSEKKIISELLSSFGRAIEVSQEDLIDKAIVSGCGPAYTAAFLETLAMAAKNFGYSDQQARTMALETVMGAAEYLQKTGMDFGALKNAVQTKGGVTEASFKVLNAKKWQQILQEACNAAYRRVEEMLGKK